MLQNKWTNSWEGRSFEVKGILKLLIFIICEASSLQKGQLTYLKPYEPVMDTDGPTSRFRTVWIHSTERNIFSFIVMLSCCHHSYFLLLEHSRKNLQLNIVLSYPNHSKPHLSRIPSQAETGILFLFFTRPLFCFHNEVNDSTQVNIKNLTEKKKIFHLLKNLANAESLPLKNHRHNKSLYFHNAAPLSDATLLRELITIIWSSMSALQIIMKGGVLSCVI